MLFRSIRATETHPHLNFVAVDVASLNENFVQSISKFKNVVLIADTLCENAFQDLRSLFLLLKKYNCDLPTFIKRNFVNLNDQQFQLFAATDVGGLLLDGFGDGVWMKQKNCVSSQLLNSTTFGILQGTRTRISKTEYISCPSCGRTLFDLQETTAKIRKVTDHLKIGRAHV